MRIRRFVLLLIALAFVAETVNFTGIVPVWISALVWVAAIAADVYSTHRFYVADKEGFPQNERNKVFIQLVDRAGSFRKAAFLFAACFEVPIMLLALLFLLALPIQSTVPSALSGLFILFAGVHLNAAATNLRWKKTHANAGTGEET